MITGVVLAAGTGSRLGRTKQLLLLEGKPLVQHVVDAAAAAGLHEIVVVVGHDAAGVRKALQLPANGKVVPNPDYRVGQSTSLAAGLRAASAESEGAVILLADQPGITPAAIRKLTEVFSAGRPKIVRTRFQDGPGPALLSREIWGDVAELSGDTGARELIRAHPEWVQEVSVEGILPPDVDLPQDLPRAGVDGENT
jgi:molybdenum cofactor cytidylyltransferase